MTVCNATVLIAFIRLNRLDLLRCAFNRFVIPEAVYEDVVVKGAGKPGAEDVERADWIEVQAVTDRQRVGELQQFLGKGESEAIVLAKEIGATLIVLDDRKARELARQEGLVVVGSLGVLKGLKERGELSVLKPLFEELKAVGFYMGEEYDEILWQVGEK